MAKKKAENNIKTYLFDTVSFQAQEAYKALRTNLEFTLFESKTRIIGITSSNRGEGKSTLSINLAFAIAQNNKKVILIDGDLRLPSISQKLNCKQDSGLSNILNTNSDIRQTLKVMSLNDYLCVLPSGPIPPNPSELLGSKRLTNLLTDLSHVFDYIIIDLPPVNLVPDATVIANKLDGLIFAVREHYAKSNEVKEALRRLNLVQARVLGFVLTDDNVRSSSRNYYSRSKKNAYYKEGYYNKYDYDYYRKNEGKIKAEERNIEL